MKVVNNTGAPYTLPDGQGNKITLQPGENEIPSFIMDNVKKCLGPERWPHYAQFIIVEGDKIVDPTPVKKKKDMTAEELLPIIRKTSNDKVLIELINNENQRKEPRKTVTDAIEKRMISLGKEREAEKKKKEEEALDGEHDKE